MPPITALLHTYNDGLRLGRALETLLPCSEILIVDHHSDDRTLHVARQYSTRILTHQQIVTRNRETSNAHALATNPWIFHLSPSEAFSESLQAALYEWTALPDEFAPGTTFSVPVRQQSAAEWIDLAPETRLIPRNWKLFKNGLAAQQPSSQSLDGFLLRLSDP